MTPFLQLAIAMVVLIAAAKAGGYASYRLGQPSVLGELIVGILTLLSVVDEEAKLDQMIAIAQDVIGDLDNPHTGFLFVVPVLRAYGLGKHRKDRSKE